VRLKRRWLLGLLLLCFLAALSLMRWGGYLTIASDPLPSHADVAVILQGSVQGEIARVAGAVRILREGVADNAALSVPKESYWGQSVPEAARAYLERKYGAAITGRFVFCETGPEVNSTKEEAEALRPCIQEHGWRKVIVVTSNYHTRRAGRIWRSALKNAQPRVEMSIYGVDDPEFQPRGWWRNRLWAKTWFYEVTKVVTEAL